DLVTGVHTCSLPISIRCLIKRRRRHLMRHRIARRTYLIWSALGNGIDVHSFGPWCFVVDLALDLWLADECPRVRLPEGETPKRLTSIQSLAALYSFSAVRRSLLGMPQINF